MPRTPRVFVEGGIYHAYNRFSGARNCVTPYLAPIAPIPIQCTFLFEVSVVESIGRGTGSSSSPGSWLDTWPHRRS